MTPEQRKLNAFIQMDINAPIDVQVARGPLRYLGLLCYSMAANPIRFWTPTPRGWADLRLTDRGETWDTSLNLDRVTTHPETYHDVYVAVTNTFGMLTSITWTDAPEFWKSRVVSAASLFSRAYPESVTLAAREALTGELTDDKTTQRPPDLADDKPRR